MEHSILSKLLVLVFVILAVFYTGFFVVNIMCRTSVQSCTVDSDCMVGTVCVDHGQGEVRCAPPACKTAQSGYNATGIERVTNRVIAWTARESSALSHWLLRYRK